MKKSIFALVGAALMLASGFVFTGCSSSDDEENGAATMTVKLVFEDFEPASVNLTVYNGKTKDDGYETVKANLAADKKTATATVTNKHTNDDGWLTVEIAALDSANTAIATSFSKNSNTSV